MAQRPTGGRTLLNFIRDSILTNNDLREAESIAFQVAESLSGLTKTDIIADKPLMLNDSQWESLNAIIARLNQDEPVQYILGKAWFLEREYMVNREVLIPRPETEELVRMILEENNGEELSILDIGSGSGCIAISLALEGRGWQVHSCDISPGAIEVAKQNAMNLKAKVNFFHCDILHEEPPENYDIIVSNPPYVPMEEKGELQKRVTEYEPEQAIFTPLNDPLLFYRRIGSLASSKLNPGGSVYFEIEEKRGDEVVALLKELGYDNISSQRDMQGKERIVRANN